MDFNAAEPPVGADATPQAVAMAMLDALREAQLSRAKGMGLPETKSAYEAAMHNLRSLAATKEIHEQVSNSGIIGIPQKITEGAAVTHAIENWVSLTAHYVEGFQLSTLIISELVRDSQVVAFVDAENPRDRALLDDLQGKASEAATIAPSEDAVRAKAIEQGVCPPILAGIEIRMKKVDGQWRVLSVGIGPARHTPVATAS